MKDFHILQEEDTWMHAFNLSLGVSTLFEYMCNWLIDDASAKPKELNSSSLTSVDNKQITQDSANQVLNKLLEWCFRWQSEKMVEESVEGAQFQSPGDTMEFQHKITIGLQLKPFSCRNERSFHFPLHRLFSYVVLEASKYPHHIDYLKTELRALLLSDPIQTYVLLCTALQPITLSKEIKQGMWRRNGYSMNDQVLNYAEPPFCRFYLDLDIHLVQLCSTVLSPNVFMVTSMSKFGILSFLFREYKNEIFGEEPHKEFATGLIGEYLTFLINVVTELPGRAEATISKYLLPLIKRVWIHRLASGLHSYSQLMESIAIYADHVKLTAAELDELLQEVGTKTLSTALSAPTYQIKKELWSLYDPCFPHINDSLHHNALERKPKMTAKGPFVNFPGPTHEAFSSVRPSLLLNSITIDAIKRLLYLIARKFSSQDSHLYDEACKQFSFEVNDSLFTKVLQILTLMVHTIKAMASSTAISEIMSQLLYEDDLHPSLIRACSHIFNSYQSNMLDNEYFHLGWVLDELCALSVDCRNILESTGYLLPADRSAKAHSESDKDALKQLSRNKAMASVQQAAMQFMAMLDEMSDSEEEEEQEEEDGSEENGSAMQSMNTANTAEDHDHDKDGGMQRTTSAMDLGDDNVVPVDEEPDDLCIICRLQAEEEDDELGPLGCLALVQPSVTMWPRENSELKSPENMGKLDVNEKIIFPEGTCNARIGLCGHKMHSGCFDSYFESAAAKSLLQQNIVLDANQRFLTCPLCKKLCNSFLPTRSLPIVPESSSSNNLSESSLRSSTSWVKWAFDVQQILSSDATSWMTINVEFAQSKKCPPFLHRVSITLTVVPLCSFIHIYILVFQLCLCWKEMNFFFGWGK